MAALESDRTGAAPLGKAKQKNRDINPAIRDLAVELSAIPDHDFLTEYCDRAGALIGADHFFIGRLNIYTNMVRTVHLVSKGVVAENIVYGLSGTPCERAIEGGTCLYPKRVAPSYPHDTLLQTMGIEGYVGTSIISRSGKTLGVIVALSENEIADPDLATAVVEHFRDRVACRLESLETIERYALAFSGDEEGYWDWDLKTGAMVLSESIGAMIGLSPKDRPRDLSALEALIHPEDRARFSQAVWDHSKTQAQFAFLLRLQCADGAALWFRTSGCSVTDNIGRPARVIGSLINVDKWVRDGSLADRRADDVEIAQIICVWRLHIVLTGRKIAKSVLTFFVVYLSSSDLFR